MCGWCPDSSLICYSQLYVGLSGYSLRVQSALTNVKWATHPMVRTFLKAALKIRPPVRFSPPQSGICLCCSEVRATSILSHWCLFTVSSDSLYSFVYGHSVTLKGVRATCPISEGTFFASFFQDFSFLSKVSSEFNFNWSSVLPSIRDTDLAEGKPLQSLDPIAILKALLIGQKLDKTWTVFVLPSGPKKQHSSRS